MLTAGTEWPDEDIRNLIDGKVAGLSYSAIAPTLNTSRTPKAVERKWTRVRQQIMAGESPFASGEIVDPKSLERAARLEGDPNPDHDYAPPQEGLEMLGDGNTMRVDSRSRRIKTLDQLIEECNIDQDEWIIHDHKINKWEMGAKFGAKGEEFIVVEPLWQVIAWMTRRRPEALEPVVSPVHVTIVPVPIRKAVTGLDSVFKHALVLPDPQIGFRKSLRTGRLTPFHDRLALDIALQIALDYRFDKKVWLGDLLDLAEFTDKFIRSPNYYWSTQPAAIEAKWWMTQFRMADPDDEEFALEGNHDERLREHMLKHFKEAYGLRAVDRMELPPMMTIPHILALHDINVQWVSDYPNGQVWVNKDLVCEHGAVVRAKSGGTVSAVVAEADNSLIMGHSHRLESASKTIHGRDGWRTIEVWSMGCLCRVDGEVPGVKARQNWQQAVGFVDYTDDGWHDIQPIRIANGKAVFRGKLYEGRDRVEELREATKDSKAEWQW